MTLAEKRRWIAENYPGHTNRCTGRSLSIALKTISEAIRRPGQEIQVIDHFPSRKADRFLLDMIRDTIMRLDLEGFSYNVTDITIRFDLPYAAPGASGGRGAGRMKQRRA